VLAYTTLQVVINAPIGIHTTPDITYIRDGCERATILYYKMHVKVPACKLYMKP
jgi:hypothetical protein